MKKLYYSIVWRLVYVKIWIYTRIPRTDVSLLNTKHTFITAEWYAQYWESYEKSLDGPCREQLPPMLPDAYLDKETNRVITELTASSDWRSREL